jgi:protein SCO1/2
MLHAPLPCSRFLALFFAVLLCTFEVHASRWGKDYLPNVEVVTQDGKTLRFYDDLIKDKVFVISFLFTSCTDICPLMASRLAELQEKLAENLGKDVYFYSISVDPETDTPPRLKQYADTFGAKAGWLFLTGRPDDIRAIRFKLGDRSTILSEHRNEVLLGNGQTGEWARNNLLNDLDGLALTVRSMDSAFRPVTGPGRGTLSVQPLDTIAKPGQALYARLCAGCHTVGKGDRVGPDLAGIAGRRDVGWLTSFIASPEKMRREGDSVAQALAAKFPHVRMPAFGLSKTDTVDLLTYVAGLESQQGNQDLPLEPLLRLTTHEGRRLSTELRDQPVAVFFGFTHCPDVCPTTLLDWSNVLGSLGANGDRLKVVFVSVDSDRDKPDALKAYLGSFDPRIIGLTGSAGDVAIAARSFGAYYERVGSADNFTFDHGTKVYLVGRDGRLAGSVDLNTQENDRRRKLLELLARH